MAIYLPSDVYEATGFGSGIGSALERVAQSRLAKQRQQEELAKLLAEEQEKRDKIFQAISPEIWNSLPPDAQAALANQGTPPANPTAASLVEQIQQGETPAALRSPEYKLRESTRELANVQGKVSASTGGGLNWGSITSGVGNAFSRVADVVSRSSYGVMEGIDNLVNAAQEGDLGELYNADVFRAIAGQKKTSGSDVLRNVLDLDDEEFNSLPTWAKGAIMATGLTADIALDPLTYTGAGILTKAKNIDEALDVTTALTKGLNVGETVTEAGRVSTEFADLANPVKKALADNIAQGTQDVADSLGLAGTRTLTERAGIGPAPFQPQNVARQGAALADEASLRGAGSAKAIEQAAVRAGGQSGVAAAERGARHTYDLARMKKADLLDLANQTGVDVLQGAPASKVNVKTIRARLKADARYRKVEQAATEAEADRLKEIMFDANYRISNERISNVVTDKTLALKFQSPMGRKVWATLELPGISRGWQRAVNAAIATGPGSRAADWGKKFQRSFSRMNQLGKGIHTLERANVHASYGDTAMFMRADAQYLTEAGLKNISTAENNAIYDALQAGTVDSLEPKLKEIAEGFMFLEDTRAAERLDRGLLRNSDLIYKNTQTTMAPLYFKGYVPQAVRRQIRKERIRGESLTTIFSNPKYKKYEKLVEKDLGKIAAMSARDQGERIARYNFWKDANDRFFLDTSKIGDAKVRAKAIQEAQAKGFVKLKNLTDNIVTDDLHRLFGDINVNDIYVPPELEDGLRKLTAWQYADPDTSALMETYQKIMRSVKISLTMANPGFHLRNLRGDIFLNLMDGVSDPRRYRQAQKLLSAAGDVRYQNMAGQGGIAQAAADFRIQNAGGPYAGMTVGDVASRPVMGFDVSGMETIRLGGIDLPADEVMRYFNNSGGRTGFTQAEIDKSVGARGSRSTWQRGKAAVASASEYREELPRLTHFIDKLDYRMKEAGVTATDVARRTRKFEEAMERAGADVRKFNIDYSDITRTEQKIKNAAVPFYTWMRKNTVLQMEMMFTRPVFASGWSKAVNTAKDWMEYDPYGNEITPGWIDENIGIPVGRVNNDIAAFGLGVLGLGQAPFLGGEMGPMDNTLYMTPFADTPFANAVEPFEAMATLFDSSQAGGFEGVLRPGEAAKEAARFAVNTLAPQLQIPIEMATGRSPFTGGPMPEMTEGYLPSEVSPMFKAINNAFVTGEAGPEDTARFWNWVTGGNAQMITPQIKTGETSRRLDIAEGMESDLREEILRRMGFDPNQKVMP